MKHGRRPTKAQKVMLHQAQLDPSQWLIVKTTADELLVIHRYNQQHRTIPKTLVEGNKT